MFITFALCYFLSMDALSYNESAGSVAHIGSVIGMVACAWDNKHNDKKEESK